MTEQRLSGRTAVVTGGARGIGRAIAELFAEHGARVVVLDIDPLDAETGHPSGSLLAVNGSVTSRESVHAAVQLAVQNTGRLDIMVCNAGVLHYEPFVSLSSEVWQSHLDVDLTGVYLAAQEAAISMSAIPRSGSDTSSIIVVTSISAEMPSKTQSHYAAAKAGAQMLSQALAWELGDQGIRVNSIGPGWVETRLTEDYLSAELIRADVEATIPLGRVGQPADVANAALFLASDESSYVTGAHIRIDGGLIIGKDKT